MARAATTTDPFNAVGDRTRRAVLDVLATRESTVGELADRLGCAQPQVSKHLKVLREVDLVHCRQVGRSRLYRINRGGLAPLQTWLGELSAAINDNYDRLDDYLQALQAGPDPAEED
ncbi:ArsR/SmtB family transcription factor [Polymorphospora rubra]|uniref:Putative transcriptional regulator, ArsR family protein n=1 Tax=Polymorphospora rubra TaxID=338584 RepID=A0A810N8Y5_9ACTN|nr:metalloregulator ArsR/SmtB family transcription factor [Polymorphospora rubra]BCJ68258.1 putative transcriptional regulator, ArsR family protein [Polymorphospora rubra]